MKIYEKEITIPYGKTSSGFIDYFKEQIYKTLKTDEIPIRFVVTDNKKEGKNYSCELGVISGAEKFSNLSNKNFQKPNIFDFKKRSYEKTDKFNVALVIPTGINAELGGHSGDAGALARLVGESCDTLITHPNVVNASDINELPKNGLYIEGSILSRLMMGTIGLQKVRANRLEVIVDNHEDKEFTESAINAVSAARATLGVDAKITILKDKFEMKSEYTNSGRAIGTIKKLEKLYDILKVKKQDYDAVAISSTIKIDSNLYEDYYKDKVINPWGGAEAMLTHTLSSLLNIPSAHSPMDESMETLNTYFRNVDPRKSAEYVSTIHLNCILKGLHKSPKIITNPDYFSYPNIITASDINCLVIPDKCIGLPTLAALEQGIPVIAVKENKNLMKNELRELSWSPNQLIIVENYLEAVGAICSLKSGTSLESVKRPLKPTRVYEDIRTKQRLDNIKKKAGEFKQEIQKIQLDDNLIIPLAAGTIMFLITRFLI